MDLTLIIKKALLDNHMQIGEFADKLGWTRQNLSLKFKRNDYKVSELERMAELLNLNLSITLSPKDNVNQ